MVTNQQAYMLGYYPNIIGVHFNGLEILWRARQTATGPLFARIEVLLEKRPIQAPDVIAQVQKTENILQDIGLPVDPSPQEAKEYYHWAERIANQVEKHLTLLSQNESAEKQLQALVRLWAHSVGLRISDCLHNLHLAVIVRHLLGSGNKEPFLQKQLEELATMHTQSLEQLRTVAEKAAYLKTFSPSAHQAISHMLLYTDEVDSISSTTPHDNWVVQTQTTLQKINDLNVEEWM